MAVTISTHMDTVVATEHNRRNPKVCSKEPHIDPNGHHENWIDVPPREAYQMIFGEAVERYNAKQKRADRRIDSYYNQVSKDAKKHVVYECVAGVYGAEVTEKQARSILLEYVKEWKKTNPNMIIIGAYFHADESKKGYGKDGKRGKSKGVHCHIDFIPCARGFKRGLDTQNSLTKALERQGFRLQKGHVTAQMQWTRSENDRLERICNAHGLEVIHPQRDQNVKHKSTKLYKLDQDIKHASKEKQAIKDYNAKLREGLQSQLKELQDAIVSKRQELEKLNSIEISAAFEAFTRKLIDHLQCDNITISDGKQSLKFKDFFQQSWEQYKEKHFPDLDSPDRGSR